MVAQLARILDPAVLDSSVRGIECALVLSTAGLYFLLCAGLSAAPLPPPWPFLCGYPYWIINTANIADGVLASFLLAATLWLGVRAAQTHGPFASLIFGLCLAGAGAGGVFAFQLYRPGLVLLRSRQECACGCVPCWHFWASPMVWCPGRFAITSFSRSRSRS